MDLKPYVVLLHGLGRTKQVMAKMASFLASHYYVYNDDYQSTTASIETLTEKIASRINEHCPDPERIMHFVGHSMGALIIRLLLAKYRPKRLGRVVMLAPPNQGSQLVDFLKRFAWYRRAYGPAGQEIGTDKNSIIHRLPPIDYDVGVIAGNRTIDWLISWFILPKHNDGKVTVAETKVAGMNDHIILPATHTFMPSNQEVMKETLFFLENGYFSKK